MKCSNCGAELSENSKFCPYCGQKMVAATRYYDDNIDVSGDIDFFDDDEDFYDDDYDIPSSSHAETSRKTRTKANTRRSSTNKRTRRTTAKRKQNKPLIKWLILVVVVLFIMGCVSAVRSTTSQQDAEALQAKWAALPRVETSITKGTEYAYMTDEWNVYIATAIADDIITIENWNKSLSSDKTVEFEYDLGTFKINDAENDFAWVDDERTSFVITFADKNNSKFRKGRTAVFTINISDSDTNKGSDYAEDIACYSYQNDDWHLYRAIPLTESLIKIETWYRGSSTDQFLFGYDMDLIDTTSGDTDFEWTDDDHTSFLITTKDNDNDHYWKKESSVLFTLENENYAFTDVKSYLGKWVVEEGEAAVPAAASDYENSNYQDVQKELGDAGFTNISTEVLYDIFWGITEEGEVESVSIDGRSDFEKGEVFSQNVPIIITYHMNEEDDPNQSADNMDEGSDAITTTSEETTETAEQKPNLTVENCPELAAMLSNKAEIDSSYSVFAAQYKGRTIEFDGRIDYCTNHGSYNTRFDYLVSAGDYDPDHQIGPTFKFEDVAYYDLHTDLDTVSVGLNVHIVAEVKSFDSNTGLFYLDPISVTGR